MRGIDGYFAFLEEPYAGEIARRFGVAVESPVDLFNWPRHRGDFGLRVPPSQRAMREFLARWRGLAWPGAQAVRASELCGRQDG
jgi:integrase/recombinase XerC